ncbi:MAG: hypothetical protein F4058_06910 [Rhodothermaceae bacterium]|nr:hypothetical protein [Rhodothermaceae bacterium]MYF63979.1 hypothetical protein [Rhodothermaceae bacterium]MYI85050.1 hypothetical protein [Rhodothermaceae bacterium]
MSDPYTVLEHQEFPKLNKRDLDELEDFHHRHRVFGFGTNGRLRAENYVGVVTTRLGTVIEILPKIELGDTESPGHEQTREAFLGMLRAYGGLNNAKNLPPSVIRTLRHFPVLEIFIRLFLVNLNLLVRGGLGRQYRAVQENLPFLRGRIVFRDHLRENLVDRSRFYVEHDELNPNRPANRLIRATLDRLKPIVRNERNRQLLADVAPAFRMIPASADLHTDWRIHSIDRYMQHYKQVMQWVELFLFNRGPATYSGKHINQSLLFPMEQVYEHYVTHCFRRYQNRFKVVAQGPRKRFMVHGHTMKPDISLRTSSGAVRFILDAKWKHIGNNVNKSIDDVISSDLYQLYAYGKRFNCQTVALVYPRNKHFTRPSTVRFFDDLKLALVPFDVSSSKASECSVRNALRELGT